MLDIKQYHANGDCRRVYTSHCDYQKIQNGRGIESCTVGDVEIGAGVVSASVCDENGSHHQVSLKIDEAGDIILCNESCDCLDCSDSHKLCRHAWATAYAVKERLGKVLTQEVSQRMRALLPASQPTALSEGTDVDKRPESDVAAVKLLKRSTEQILVQSEAGGRALGILKLEPVLHGYYGNRGKDWSLSFRLGNERMYSIRDLGEFRDRVLRSKCYTLGSSNKQWVGREAFAESSLPWLDFILTNRNKRR
jgi:hypothetical protein